jgi:5'-nucleotidase
MMMTTERLKKFTILHSKELTELGNPKVVSTSCQNVLEEYFSHHQNLNSQIEGRLVYK